MKNTTVHKLKQTEIKKTEKTSLFAKIIVVLEEKW